MNKKEKKKESAKVVEPTVDQNQKNDQEQKPETGQNQEQDKNPSDQEQNSPSGSENETVEDKGGLTFESAKAEMAIGAGIKLPEWKGFWFEDIDTHEVYVLTEDGEILDTPDEKYQERNDWEIALATEEQAEILEKFWKSKSLEKTAKKEHQKLLSTKVVKFNRSFDGAFQKISYKLTYEEVLERKNIPADAVELLLEDGRVFNLLSFSLTNKTL